MSSRRPSPLDGRKPTKEDLPRFATEDSDAIDDVLPRPEAEAGPAAAQDPPWPHGVRLLIVGVNPGLWTAAVNAPFARPGNRFWPSLHRAGLTDHLVDCAVGLSEQDEAHLAAHGLGMTNLSGRATVRADELTKDELREGARAMMEKVRRIRPGAVAIAGITAYRTAFSDPKAKLGRQDAAEIEGWPEEIPLWVVPQPSGLNAHENIDTLAEKWRAVWEDVPAG